MPRRTPNTYLSWPNLGMTVLGAENLTIAQAVISTGRNGYAMVGVPGCTPLCVGESFAAPAGMRRMGGTCAFAPPARTPEGLLHRVFGKGHPFFLPCKDYPSEL